VGHLLHRRPQADHRAVRGGGEADRSEAAELSPTGLAGSPAALRRARGRVPESAFTARPLVRLAARQHGAPPARLVPAPLPEDSRHGGRAVVGLPASPRPERGTAPAAQPGHDAPRQLHGRCCSAPSRPAARLWRRHLRHAAEPASAGSPRPVSGPPGAGDWHGAPCAAGARPRCPCP
jgi:hypothetical protein